MKLHSKAQLSEKCILVARYDFVPYLIQDEIKDIIIADVFLCYKIRLALWYANHCIVLCIVTTYHKNMNDVGKANEVYTPSQNRLK